jgi:DNA-binding NarL/FixJ family response regulator
MINIPKVLIFSQFESDRQLLKDYTRQMFKRSILIIAEEKEGFLQKMDWLLPDLIIIQMQKGDDNTGLEAFFHLKCKYPFLPVVFVMDKSSYPGEIIHSIERMSNGVFSIEELSLADSHLLSLVDKTSDKNKHHVDIINQGYSQKMKFHKMEQVIRNAEEFREKAVVLNLLDELSKNINGTVLS